jgi:cytochrome c oxidase assembly protein subunit 11
VTVAFDTNVRGLAWQFHAERAQPAGAAGRHQPGLLQGDQHLGPAADRPGGLQRHPESAGAYFSKLECFCFKNQTLAPHQTAEFPVVYFVDPRFGQNDDTRGIEQITLSYTFYPAQPLAAKPGQGYSTP